MADLKALKESVDIVSVIGRFVKLEKRNREHEACCPFHEEKTPSFKVLESKQFFKCFGCGKAGDVWDFLYAMGMSTPEAVAYLQGGTDWAKRPAKLEKPRIKWTTIVPTQEPPHPQHPSLGVPDMLWKYHTADAQIWGYVCRFNTGRGKKEFRQYTYCQSETGTREWRWQSWEKPRPLYNLHLLSQHPSKPVILVEGEKCADWINTNTTDYIGTTWMHGVESLKYMDLTPLTGRQVYSWPDNDEVGYKAMSTISDMIGGFSGTINNPTGAEKGWDCADMVPFSGMTMAETASRYIADNLVLTEDMNGIKESEQTPSVEDDFPPHVGSDYFRILGYEKTEQGQIYHFFSYPSQTMISLSATGISKIANIIQLAPLQWWETNYPKSKGGVDINAVVNALVSTSYEVGFFSDKWIRGRGAWIDESKVVIHAGDRLIVDGKEKHFKDHKSKYIYERNEDLEFNTGKPLKKSEASKLLDITKMLPWEREVNAHLLAGWCIVAPICGALNWRPHIWLTGPAGTGKSWIYSKIVRKCLGEVSLSVQGETTEAGLRQTLRHDALPVVFDEAEGAERKDQDRLQNILGLIRQSSSHDGGVIVKGTAGGGSSKTYKIRSCFALASIAVQLEQQSDRTRVTVLSLKKVEGKEKREEQWKKLQAYYAELFTDEFCKRLMARTISMMPTILKNAEVFSNAAATELGEQRSGDQIGVLLAGAFSLVSDSVISYPQAIDWIKQHDWAEERSLSNTRDEIQLVRHILDQKVRADFAGTIMEQTVGELVMIACGREATDFYGKDSANKALRKNGLKIDVVENEICLIVANQNDQIKRWLQSEPRWQRNHNKLLRRISGSITVSSTAFAGPIKCRAVAIPLSVLDE